MSSLTSKLKKWGAQGSEYPDGYNYLEGEQPVDEWDNFLTYNLIDEIHALQAVVNDRMESDVSASHPESPEVGHISHRTDTSSLPSSKEATFVRDGTNDVWHRLLKADGDVMEGVLNMGGYRIKKVGDVATSNDNAGLETSGTGSGHWAIVDRANDTEPFRVEEDTEEVLAHEAATTHEWFRNHDGGSVGENTLVPVGTFGLDDGETLQVTQATLSEDGFKTAADDGLDLIIAPDSATAESDTVKVLTGDGSTIYDDETGRPLASYTNSSGGHQTVIIGLDNGHFNAGSGTTTSAFASYIARVI